MFLTWTGSCYYSAAEKNAVSTLKFSKCDSFLYFLILNLFLSLPLSAHFPHCWTSCSSTTCCRYNLISSVLSLCVSQLELYFNGRVKLVVGVDSVDLVCHVVCATLFIHSNTNVANAAFSDGWPRSDIAAASTEKRWGLSLLGVFYLIYLPLE